MTITPNTMSRTDNASNIIRSWEQGFERTKSSYFERCLDAVGISTDWKANDNELDEPEKTEYGEAEGSEDRLIQDSLTNNNHIF